MAELLLSAQPVREQYGAVVDIMPILISGIKNGKQVDIPREIMSIDFLYDQRENGQEPFKTNMRKNYFFTAAGALKSREGNQKWDVRSPLLRNVEVVNQNNLSMGAVRISDEQYEATTGKGVIELTREEVAELDGKTYVRKEGTDIFVPESDGFEKVQEHLNQGRVNMPDYAGTVAEDTSSRLNRRVDRVVGLYFDESDHDSAVVRSVGVDRTDSYSYVSGSYNLDNGDGRLVGVARDALDTFDNVDGKVPTSRELAQIAWQYLGNVDVRRGLTRKGLEDAFQSRRYFY
jgi:hypothetical protein